MDIKDEKTSCKLIEKLNVYAGTLGFDGIGVSGVNLSHAESGLSDWLKAGFHGDMHYMARYALQRARPLELFPGTKSIISVRLPYLPESIFRVLPGELTHAHEQLVHYSSFHLSCRSIDWRAMQWMRLMDPLAGYISLYARGRDYHKFFRKQLNTLAEFMSSLLGSFMYRVFTDSAPVMEVEIAKNASLGWRGKNTLLLNRNFGSFFFLGEIFTNLPISCFEQDVLENQPLAFHSDAEKHKNCRANFSALVPISLKQIDSHSIYLTQNNDAVDVISRKTENMKAVDYCGTCRRCVDVCPTGAIVSPYHLDARRCISYLTIEFKGTVPLALRRKIGNRIYGCDDCQLVCPWNKFAKKTILVDFTVRNNFDKASALALFSWTEEEFYMRTAGSAIRRIGYQQWVRNIVIVLGNALASNVLRQDDQEMIINALCQRFLQVSPLVDEHITWALNQSGSYSILS